MGVAVLKSQKYGWWGQKCETEVRVIPYLSFTALVGIRCFLNKSLECFLS